MALLDTFRVYFLWGLKYFQIAITNRQHRTDISGLPKNSFLILTLIMYHLSGKEFNKDGNAQNWWTPQSEAGFKQRSKCLVDQYSKYSLYNKNVSAAIFDRKLC